MSSSQSTYRVQAGGSLRGEALLPGDKSISHRAAILAAIAEGETTISNFCEGKDCLSTLAALSALGANVKRNKNPKEITVSGKGLRGLTLPRTALDMGNSGTAIRLLCGVLAGMGQGGELYGDESLNKRPMKRIIFPLESAGVQIESQNGTPPLRIIEGYANGQKEIQPINYRSDTASAQLKSCLLLAGLYADGESLIETPMSRDHTERLLAHFGWPVTQQGNALRVKGGAKLQAKPVEVPADISAAMFFMVGASIATNSDITMQAVGANIGRTGGIEILRAMGASIDVMNERMLGAEPVADIRVRYIGALKAIDIPAESVVAAIDEFPILFVAAACANGTTTINGLAELRVKESDRIETMSAGLRAMGINVATTHDCVTIEGGQLKGATVDSGGDHRVAMSFAIAALASESSQVVIENCDNVATSWPDFVAQASKIGLDIEEG